MSVCVCVCVFVGLNTHSSAFRQSLLTGIASGASRYLLVTVEADLKCNCFILSSDLSTRNEELETKGGKKIS
uniref:Putative secreted protein n=1 Tax=Anopheles darlingi TaxID=43151 RepID=A0A2M4DA17_ANODA